jgi:hypothetical protein
MSESTAPLFVNLPAPSAQIHIGVADPIPVRLIPIEFHPHDQARREPFATFEVGATVFVLVLCSAARLRLRRTVDQEE